MAQYPLPVFHFTVEWGGTRVGFSEVTGLTQENQAIEYRDGSFPEYSLKEPSRYSIAWFSCVRPETSVNPTRVPPHSTTKWKAGSG